MYQNFVLSETEENVLEVRRRKQFTFNLVDEGISIKMWKNSQPLDF